ncbi:hypothetical protein, conserved [Eimeria maxima]|uniref:Uncharacterized protein n=1 Tax=Eimeria maxima TaxID=5804 RepID=U6MJT5_EIMMA|nr:hypothetical protein, conserved [Eimeria maxima]CDJ61910.1 hypothetical protein, conserved [Eimeria maxima]
MIIPRGGGLGVSGSDKESRCEGPEVAALRSQLAAAKLALQEGDYQRQRLRQRMTEMQTETEQSRNKQEQQHEETLTELAKKLRAAKVRISQLKTEKTEIELEQQRMRQTAAAIAQEMEITRKQLQGKDNEIQNINRDYQRVKQLLQNEQTARESQKAECQRLTQVLEGVQEEAEETRRSLTAAAAAAAADWEARLSSLQQAAVQQQEEALQNAADERRRALETLREELRVVHNEEIQSLNTRIIQKEEEKEKIQRQNNLLKNKIEEINELNNRFKNSSRKDKTLIRELEIRIQGLLEDQSTQQQQITLLQQQISLLQQEKAALTQEADAAARRHHRQQHHLQETQKTLEETQTLLRAAETEKDSLAHRATQLQFDTAKATEELSSCRRRLCELWFEEQLRVMEESKLSLEAHLANREEELENSRALLTRLETRTADLEKQCAIERAELQHHHQLQQQLEQERIQQERELAETKAAAAAERQQLECRLREEYTAREERLQRETETETRRLAQQLRDAQETYTAETCLLK